MMTLRNQAFVWALTAAAITATGTASAQELQRGRTLAEENCASCHTITPGGAFKEYPPSFASIAVYRSTEQIRGRIVIPPYHSSMPRYVEWKLDQSDIDALVDYIQSLEPPTP